MTNPAPNHSPAPTPSLPEHLTALLLAAGATAVLFSAVWGRALFFRDVSYWSFPGFFFIRQSLAAGEVPLWSPYLLLGYPFLAEVANAALYPLTWAIALFRLPLAMTIYVAVHYVLTGYLMWRLLRAWSLDQLAALFGALVWMASGYLVSIHLNFNYLIPAAWYPGVLYAFHGLAQSRRLRWLMATAAAWALILLGGDPQAFLFAGFLLLAYAGLACPPGTGSRQKLLALLGLVGCLTLALVQAQILPSLEYAAACTRAQGIDFPQASAWSHHPLRLLEWIWPELFGPIFPAEKFWGQFLDPKNGTPWVGVVYLGLFPLGLALGQLRRFRQAPIGFLAFIAVLFFLLALGAYSPLYRLLWIAFPPWRIFRFPEKHLALVTFALAGLSAFGFQGLLGREAKPARRSFFQRWLIFTALLAAAFAVLFLLADPLAQALARYLARAYRVAREPGLIRASLLNAALRSLLAALLYGLVGWLFQRRQELTPRLGLVLLLVTAADLLALGQAQFHGANVSLFTFEPEAGRIIRSDRKDPAERIRFYRSNQVSRPSEFFRPAGAGLSEQAVYWNRDTLNRNAGVAEGLEDLFGYDPAKFARSYRFRQKPLAIETLRMLNVKYLLDGVQAEEVPDALGLPVVGRDDRLNLRVLRNEGYFPRAFFVDGVQPAQDEDQFLDLLAGTNLRRNVILLRPPSGRRAGTTFLPASILSYRPQQVAAAVTNPAPGFLVLSDSYFPGWKAAVDGQPARILRANYLVRAVALEPGDHQVVFTYRPLPWRVGAIATLVSLLWLVLLLSRRTVKEQFMQKIITGVIVILLPLLVGAGIKDKLKEKLQAQPAPAASAARPEEPAGIKFKLTDADVQAAMAWGKAHKQAELMAAYQGIWGGGLGGFSMAMGAVMPKALVATRYYQLAAYAQEQTSKYLEADPKRVEEIRSGNGLTIVFTATNLYPEFPKNLHVVLKQGEKVIQPASIEGKDQPPKLQVDEHSKTYYGFFSAAFSEADLDPKAKSTLVIIDTARNWEQKISLDFAKMK